jgi:pyrimidine-specific ribonucleoside hydrolase
MKKILSCLIALSLGIALQAHPWKPNHYVIIDSDGGTDDMKAISMMLASPDVRVLAIIASPGTLDAEKVYIKIRSLLNSYYHEGIPVGINRNSLFKSPDFPMAMNYEWGDESGIDPSKATDYIEVIKNILRFEKTKISFICLGSLSSAEGAMKEIPEFGSSVKEIIWSCNGLKDKKGFNYNIDRSSADKILTGKIPIRAVHSENKVEFFDSETLLRTDSINSPYAKKISAYQNSPEAKGHQFSSYLNDELVPLYLHFPDAFKQVASGTSSDCSPDNWIVVKNGFLKILKGETVMKNQVIKELPSDPSFYFPDVEPYVKDIINKYGESEWAAGVLANELHRHLGVFAIIGVKMGIRAREYFDTGVDEFRAFSWAGSEPPLSCMNDGLQVSTGATPGHGLLTVVNDTITSPVAEFTYMNQRIRLTLQPEIAAKISSELKEINFVYGLDSNIYWELVRKNSLKYWKELDRHDIFIIEVLN